MASRLLFRHRYLLPSFRLRICPATTTTVACATSLLAAPLIVHRAYTFNKPMLLDSFSTSQSPLQREPKTPLINDGRWNGKALKQVSAGSILGLVGGVVVSFFSKPLALVIGLLVVAVQALESRGIHLVPYQRIQAYAKGINVRSSLQSNVAFKLSFGVTFALAAFAQF